MAAAQVRQVLINDKMLVEIMGLVVAEVHRETDKKIAALDAKIARLEVAMAEFGYKGTWQEGTEYRKGNFVSQGGAFFHCNQDNAKAKPGTDGAAWTLAVARGRDGRDGKDYAPSDPRAVATAARPGSPVRAVRTNR